MESSQQCQFASHLSGTELVGYKKKITDLGITDPYLVLQVAFYLLKSLAGEKKVPDIEYPDLMNYLQSF